LAELRLFWALNLPGELKTKLAGFQAELKKISPDAKWVEQENLHLTVKFLGAVESSRVPALTQAVAKSVSGLAPFRLELAGWGTFGRPARVLWTGVTGDLADLQELRTRVEAALVPLGFAAEKKPFSPHLTLARFRSSRNLVALREQASALAAEQGLWGEFMVDRIDLMRSTLTRQGPVYRVISAVDLTDNPGQL
jgi:2'-5' RNA ligase